MVLVRCSSKLHSPCFLMRSLPLDANGLNLSNVVWNLKSSSHQQAHHSPSKSVTLAGEQRVLCLLEDSTSHRGTRSEHDCAMSLCNWGRLTDSNYGEIASNLILPRDSHHRGLRRRSQFTTLMNLKGPRYLKSV